MTNFVVSMAGEAYDANEQEVQTGNPGFNLYYQADGQPIRFGEESLAEWQERGREVHSLVADPFLVDPVYGDYTRKPGSHPPRIGFHPIHMSQVGRTK